MQNNFKQLIPNIQHYVCCPKRIRTSTNWTKTSCPAIRRSGNLSYFEFAKIGVFITFYNNLYLFFSLLTAAPTIHILNA